MLQYCSLPAKPHRGSRGNLVGVVQPRAEEALGAHVVSVDQAHREKSLDLVLGGRRARGRSEPTGVK